MTYAISETFLKHKSKTAIRFYDGETETIALTFAELDADSNRMAAFLMNMNVGKGDRVIICLPKSLFFITTYLAVLKLNAIAVPLNPAFKAGELSYLIQDSQAKLALVGPEQKLIFDQIDPHLTTVAVDTTTSYRDIEILKTAPRQLTTGTLGSRKKKIVQNCAGYCCRIQGALSGAYRDIHRLTQRRRRHKRQAGLDNSFFPRPLNGQDPALIIYTSGTTGNPKGAVLTQRNLIHDALNIINIWRIRDTDVLCHALPLFHIHGLCFALSTALLAGAETIMLKDFNPQTVIAHLGSNTAHHKCSIFMAVPSMYIKLLDLIETSPTDFSHLRLITSGSAPLLPKDFQRIKRLFGQEPVEREGMSETGMNFSNPLTDKKKPGSIGIPLPNVAVKIVDPKSLQPVPNGEVGEIWLKGPSIIKTYWQKPAETANTFVDGWFRSGDLGYVDQDGYYFLTDRIKHIIISGGENISPKEVETTINSMTEVAESAVVGIADELWGEKVVAAVVPRVNAALSTDNIIAHCKSQLHAWKCPKEIAITNQLPRNTMGKILKEEVKHLFINLKDSK